MRALSGQALRAARQCLRGRVRRGQRCRKVISTYQADVEDVL